MSKFRIYFRSSSTAFISTIVTKVSAFVSVWILNQVLTKEAYGNYEFAFSLISILLILGSAGFQHIAMYRLSRIDAPPESLEGESLAGKLLKYSLMSSSLVSLIVVGVAFIWSGLENSFWIVGLTLLIPLKALHGIYDAWFRARQLIAESILYYEMLPAIAKVCFLCICWLIWPNIYVVVGAILLSEFLPLTVRYIMTPLNLFRVNKGSVLTLWDFKYAGQLAITTGISKTVKYADILMMGILATSTQVAEYVIASKLAFILYLAHGINNKILTPRIGNFLSNQDFASIHEEYHYSRILTLSCSFCGAIVFTLFGYQILELFGEYGNSYSTLMILCSTYLLTTSFGMSGGYLNIAGYSNLTLYTTILVLIINIGLNYWLIPILGSDGAAVAMLVSFGVTNIITSFLILYKDGVKTYSISLTIHTFFAVVILLFRGFMIFNIVITTSVLLLILVSLLYSERDFLRRLISNFNKYLTFQNGN
ncbi:MATE family efflux transporter [Fodinibius saliphilus]|uniref:MATE family efflux transporter n=1 Tax=Fodinibius saliphilus TaxID=1920650 RepID=UPI00110965CF|nr:polysaccharide biosynthesis C-terminal domain-containing protein [Fodinibius saliphilus]